jgi:cell filamentation protein
MPNPYTNESGVFRNKAGISNESDLRTFEYKSTRIREAELTEGRIVLPVQDYGLDRLKAIHGYLLQDVYEWAGKERTVQSSKRAADGLTSVFEHPDKIHESWQALAKEAQEFAQAKGLGHSEKQQRLASIYIEANRIHAFPEGNGRSLRIYMAELAKEQGIAMDYTRTNEREWNLASASSAMRGRVFEGHFYPVANDPEPIRTIFEQIARPSLAYDYERKPESAAAGAHPQLSPVYEGLRLIESKAAQTPHATPEQTNKYMHQVSTQLVQRLDQNKSAERIAEQNKTTAKPPQDLGR